jgi:hypothetical protein
VAITRTIQRSVPCRPAQIKAYGQGLLQPKARKLALQRKKVQVGVIRHTLLHTYNVPRQVITLEQLSGLCKMASDKKKKDKETRP